LTVVGACWRHSLMANIDDATEMADDAHHTGIAPLVLLLTRVWRDVNGRIWETRSDDWAKVLRTMRSKRVNYYSRRFGWFNSAIQTVLTTSAVAKGPDMELIRLFRALDVPALSRLVEAMRRGLSTGVFGPKTDEQEEEYLLVHEDLQAFAADLGAIVERYPALLERLRAAHSEVLWAGLYDDDTEDAEWEQLAYELRKHGFEPAEIAPLVDALPQANALSGEPLRRRDLTRKARNRLRSQTDRTFARTGEQKPPPGWGARGSREDACAVLSIRVGPDADDDEPDRTHAPGGSQS
jgi:hypothetical protein